MSKHVNGSCVLALFGSLTLAGGLSACSGAEHDNGVSGPLENANTDSVADPGGSASGGQGSDPAGDARGPTAPTVQDRLDACARDPRVIAGLVSQNVCAGADIFFRETFDGNGRTCGTCHPVANNTTLDVPFITALHQTNPNDALFVFETNPALSQLETSDLLQFAAILENVDGFQDPKQRFVSRTVSHVLSLATSTTPDVADGTSNSPAESTGWAGDGAPGDGSLRAFLEGAIKQHFTKDLERLPGLDFRLPTEQEAELTRSFQLSLGRLNELNLEQVRLFDPEGEEGRQAFLDPLRGRCNVCHTNAGANFIDTGKNRNFDSGVRSGSTINDLTNGVVDGIPMEDGGFGGADLERPNLDTFGSGKNAFGDGTFSPPPLIEAADTAPFFHNALRATDKQGAGGDINGAVGFYATPAFRDSPGAKLLDQKFGAVLDLQASDAAPISRFLRVLNAAFNVGIAHQRLTAASTLASRFQDTRADVQKRLAELAAVEIDDALEVLETSYPDAQEQLTAAKDEVLLALVASSWSERQSRIANAASRCASARELFGANITFVFGAGNLMY